jgi:phosphoenolpyruvate synthase/pyruvate phosphate dikinase
LSDFKTNEYASLLGGRWFEPIEANPMLWKGQRYAWKATALKLGVSFGGLAIQRYVLRKHPQHRTAATIVNFGMAGATAGVAVRNWRMR